MEINWYGLCWIVGFLVFERYLHYIAPQRGISVKTIKVSAILFFLSCLVGARIGKFVLYKPSILITHPLEILKIHEGGLSFFGAFLFSIPVMYWVAKRFKTTFFRTFDPIITAGPILIFFVRIGNFINGEHYGTPTNMPWGMEFTKSGDTLNRHPSQIYEALLEGILMFLILNFCWKLELSKKTKGFQTVIFCIFYGAIRFICEFFRTPTQTTIVGLTYQQIYALGMFVGASFLYKKVSKINLSTLNNTKENYI